MVAPQRCHVLTSVGGGLLLMAHKYTDEQLEQRRAYCRRWHAARRHTPEYKAANTANAKAYYRTNSERVKAYQKQYAKDHPEKLVNDKKAYYLRTKPVRSAYAKAKYEANPEAVKKRVRAWAEANPEKVRAISRHIKHRRRAREKCSPEEGVLIKQFLAKHAAKRLHTCYFCGARFTGVFHVDHIQPLARNGLHAAFNLCIACPPCNLSKNAKPLEEVSMKKAQILFPI